MASEYTVELGKRIRAARIKAGLTQSELAERADVSTNHILAIERGRCMIPEWKCSIAIAMVPSVRRLSADRCCAAAKYAARQSLSSLAERVDDTEKMARYILHGVELMVIKQPKLCAPRAVCIVFVFCGLHNNQFVV